VHLFMPANATERAWWIAVSVLAGVGEEITWRGVQTSLLRTFTGSLVLAIVLCAAQFGLSHAIQGWKSASVVTAFALGFHGLVLLSGSLLPAMAVHVVYDLTAGLNYGKLGRELGYEAEAASG
jgi:membrane protease YdiL (CAAX protease family)